MVIKNNLKKWNIRRGTLPSDQINIQLLEIVLRSVSLTPNPIVICTKADQMERNKLVVSFYYVYNRYHVLNCK